MDPYILGLDIGGTKMAAGLLTQQNRLVFRRELPTEQDKGFAHSTRQMNRVIEACLEAALSRKGKAIGMGVCAPGPLDPKKGILFNPPNLKGWHDLPLLEQLQKRYELPIKIDNDANAAGLAEALWGAAAAFEHVFYATVSTGIGTGIVLNKRIFHGKNGLAGEGGHVSFYSGSRGRRCNCGNTSCIEAYASGTSAAKRAREKLKNLSPKPPILEAELKGDWRRLSMRILARAARQGDAFSQQIIQETGTYLGRWLGGIISLLDPDIIVLGGGVTQIGEALFAAVREEIPKATINRFAGQTPVVKASFDKDVGIFGAAALIQADLR